MPPSQSSSSRCTHHRAQGSRTSIPTPRRRSTHERSSRTPPRRSSSFRNPRRPPRHRRRLPGCRPPARPPLPGSRATAVPRSRTPARCATPRALSRFAALAAFRSSTSPRAVDPAAAAVPAFPADPCPLGPRSCPHATTTATATTTTPPRRCLPSVLIHAMISELYRPRRPDHPHDVSRPLRLEFFRGSRRFRAFHAGSSLVRPKACRTPPSTRSPSTSSRWTPKR